MPERTDPPLPGWLRATVISGLLAALFLNLGADIWKANYNGNNLSLLLVGTLGTTVGVERLIREGIVKKRNSDSEEKDDKSGT